MILKKIRKHALIAERRVKFDREMKRIAQYKNPLLAKVLEAFFKVKKSRFSSEDLLAFDRCESYRQKLMKDNTIVSYEVFGSDQTSTVAGICKRAASKPKWCQLLYALADIPDQPVVLEIGTNVGISGSYILECIKDKAGSRFVSMEGLPQLCELSSGQFENIVPKEQFEVVQGLYDTTFPEMVSKKIPFNLLFIDGNHKKDPTLEYLQQLKLIISYPSIIIFDDINWSEGMKEAWKIIKEDKDVNYSIDLYNVGIVILDREDEKRNVGFEFHLAY